MNQTNSISERHVIPRWRKLREVIVSHEVLTCRRQPSETPVAVDVEKLSQAEIAWRTERSLPVAMELLSQLRISGLPDDSSVIDFIRERIRHAPEDLPLIRDYINSTIVGTEDRFTTLPCSISSKRTELSLRPRNPLLWLELARDYVNIGLFAKSEKCLQIASTLAPDNRFIIRCKARYYHHIHDYDKALFVLRSNSLANSDPWIISGEIAMCGEMSRPSPRIKLGRGILQDARYDPRSTSELASELATIEGQCGENKKSKKLFRQALTLPTENAFAQAVWASKNIVTLDDHLLSSINLEDNFEGGVYLGIYTDQDWTRIVGLNDQWHKYQPFSSSPVAIGSLILDDFLDDYAGAIELCLQGIPCSCEPYALYNNLAYSYLLSGDAEKANRIIQQYLVHYRQPREEMLYYAMLGMREMRIGELDKGKEFYQHAQDVAPNNEDQSVFLYYTRELKHAGLDVTMQVQDIEKRLRLSSNVIEKALFKKFFK